MDLSRYMLNLFHQGSLEVLARRTATSVTSRVYLLGVTDDTKESLTHFTTVVKMLKPSTLFLELDQMRNCYFTNQGATNELITARNVAQRLGIEIILGDQNIMDSQFMQSARQRELIAKYHPNVDLEDILEEDYNKIEDRVYEEIVLGFRDRYMVDGLLKIEKPSILGVVGHLFLK